MSAVAINKLSKQLGRHLALDRVSLAVPYGQTTAILGESGCGKTTLLRHINGLLQPDSGTIEVLGQPIDYSHLPVLRRRMGYAVQSVGLFPHLSVAHNIALVARLSGWSKQRIEARTRQLLALMELATELLERFPHELSGGQRQRVGICRAMMLQPELLLLDEPFSGIDPITRVRIHHEFLALLEAEPTTTVLVTHDVPEALRLATHLVIMRDGQVLQHGPVEDVAAQPVSADIASLFEDARP